MPRLMNSNDSSMETGTVGRMQAFQYSGTRIENLGATEYTLVTIAVDETYSTLGFQNDLRNCLISAVDACKKSPRSDNLLLRVIKFSTSLQGGIEEIHGFKPLSEINPADYPNFSPAGATPLFDAAFSSLGAMNAYAKKLTDDDFLVNGIAFIITDGDDNMSRATPNMIREEVLRAARGEEIESMLSVLIGINASTYRRELTRFKDEASLDQYIDAGDATKGKLAKLAAFVSQSVSSQSQALGTGGPSQNISATI